MIDLLPPWPTVARVALVRRFPLKSGTEQNPQRAHLGPDGLVGDRAWAVADTTGALLRPRHHPDLARLSLGPAPDGPGLSAADGTPTVLLDGREGSGGLDGASLAELLGVPGAHLVAVGGSAGTVGLAGLDGAPRAALHLVGDDAASDPRAPAGADPGLRANLVLSALEPGAERAWVGARLRVGAGGALLEVTALPRRCLGVYAAVMEPGEVAVGDAVALGPTAAGERDQ